MFKKSGFLIFAFLAVIALSALRDTMLWSSGRLVDLQKQIDAQVKTTDDTGRDSQVIFTPDEEGVTIVINPPYTPVSEYVKDGFSQKLADEMEYYTGSTEAGHLFCIRQGRLEDHRILSGLVEPIYSHAAGKKVVFLISRKKTDGRPVKIEISNQQ